MNTERSKAGWWHILNQRGTDIKKSRPRSKNAKTTNSWRLTGNSVCLQLIQRIFKIKQEAMLWRVLSVSQRVGRQSVTHSRLWNGTRIKNRWWTLKAHDIKSPYTTNLLDCWTRNQRTRLRQSMSLHNQRSLEWIKIWSRGIWIDKSIRRMIWVTLRALPGLKNRQVARFGKTTWGEVWLKRLIFGKACWKQRICQRLMLSASGKTYF